MISKVQTIKDKILRELNSGVYRDDRALPSRHQYMRRFKCSRMTVDRAINGLVKDGFLESRRGSGTYPASDKARKGGLSQVMLVGDYDAARADRSLAEIACRMAANIQDHIPCHMYNISDVAVHIGRFMSPGTAVIWQRPTYAELLLLDNLRQAGIRQILVGRRYRDYDFVTTDTKKSIREGLEWLVKHGDTRITCLFEKYDPDFQYIGERQLACYELAVEMDLQLDSRFLCEIPRLRGLDIISNIEQIADRIFTEDAPKNIFLSYSTALHPLLSSALRRNKIPGKDFNIVCFDYDSRLDGTAGVAMLQQQWSKIEQTAFEWVFSHKGGEQFAVQIPTKLIV